MDGDGLVGFARASSEEEELAARVGRDRLDRACVEALSKVVLLPVESLVGRVKDVVRRVFVIDDDDDASVVSELPHMGILVDLLPREAGVAREEGVTLAGSEK